MVIGQRSHYIQNELKLIRKQLGTKIGFVDKYTDVRIDQYELGLRTSKGKVIKTMTQVLGICPETFNTSNIGRYYDLIHSLFALKDIYNLKVDRLDE
ncbi:hypothetical protein [Anaerovorax odorimutans]|uniref:hypothetical protein n=1 Tax=Anaerovorax odorimutans TaxID=109327 RepID=UPI0004019840|nr:hypothetical protein [Anaerovorax odorimutans]